MSSLILILVSCKDKKEAKKIGKFLVHNKQAACVQIIKKIKSFYYYNNNFESSQESLLLIKTIKNNFNAIAKSINDLHSYEVPEILSIDIDSNNEAYANWVENQVNTD